MQVNASNCSGSDHADYLAYDHVGDLDEMSRRVLGNRMEGTYVNAEFRNNGSYQNDGKDLRENQRYHADTTTRCG